MSLCFADGLMLTLSTVVLGCCASCGRWRLLPRAGGLWSRVVALSASLETCEVGIQGCRFHGPVVPRDRILCRWEGDAPSAHRGLK